MLGLIWLSGFRGEDLNVTVNYIRQTRETKRSSLGFWPDELKNLVKNQTHPAFYDPSPCA